MNLDAMSVEKEHNALGCLFQSIINDMKLGAPVWDDFLTKATKLHNCLKATISAITSFLDAFQKIADSATNTRGATKEIGTALTRICLRHKSVEARLKTFTSALLECLVFPLQDKVEDWRKTTASLDKDHAKEFKKARGELKKRGGETLRLQKKVRKAGAGKEAATALDAALVDMAESCREVQDNEKTAVRTALIEERSRYCLFVACLKPVVDEECALLGELSHLQEVMNQLEKHTTDPFALPTASEQVLTDIAGGVINVTSSDGQPWNFRTPPSSPSSLGSRKSSMCSISSINSSNSSNSHSPSHSHYSRYYNAQQTVIPNAVGAVRLSSVSSQDSGFTSQDALFPRQATPPSSVPDLHRQASTVSEGNCVNNDGGSTPCSPSPLTGTWPNLQDTVHAGTHPANTDRPHTISSAYERGHQRPALTVYTFTPLEGARANSQPASPLEYTGTARRGSKVKPPVPQRCSSLERPSLPVKTAAARAHALSLSVPPPQDDTSLLMAVERPIYANMNDLQGRANCNNDGPPTPTPEYTPLNPFHFKAGGNDIDRDGVNTTIIEEPRERQEELCSVMVTPSRPLSAYSTPFYQGRCATVKRSGSQGGNKPPPPVRRSSSVSSPKTPTGANPLSTFTGELNGGGENEINNTESTAENRLSTSSIGSMSSFSSVSDSTPDSVKSFPQQERSSNPGVVETGLVSVAEAVKNLTDCKHTPASPVSQRRSSSQGEVIQESMAAQRTELRAQLNSLAQQSPAPAKQDTYTTFHMLQLQKPPSVQQVTHPEQQAQPHPGHGRSGSFSSFETRMEQIINPKPPNPKPPPPNQNQSFLHCLNQKLAQRSHSPHSINRTHSLGDKQSFLDSLNQKLTQHGGALGGSSGSPTMVRRATCGPTETAGRVRQWLANRTVSDPMVRQESLLDQIRRGTTLRRVKACNDRSDPRIFTH